MMDIHIVNVGQAIKKSNYWTSELAMNGYFFLSINAGAARLMLPPSKELSILDMLNGARHVVISRGFNNGREALEIMFEDGSKSPYALYMTLETVDRMFADSDNEFVFSVWTKAGWVADLPGHYRIVPNIPCLKPLDK